MDVLRLVVTQGMNPVAFGLAVGIATALALGRLINFASLSSIGAQFFGRYGDRRDPRCRRGAARLYASGTPGQSAQSVKALPVE